VRALTLLVLAVLLLLGCGCGDRLLSASTALSAAKRSRTQGATCEGGDRAAISWCGCRS
jgi:hypothetical protein